MSSPLILMSLTASSLLFFLLTPSFVLVAATVTGEPKQMGDEERTVESIVTTTLGSGTVTSKYSRTFLVGLLLLYIIFSR
jgi:hypothetical protein